MNKLFTVFTTLVSLLSYQCSNIRINDLKLNNLNGPIKVVTELQEIISGNDTILSKKVFYYNTDGFITKILNYNNTTNSSLKIGDQTFYNNNRSNRKSYRVNNNNDTIELASYTYKKNSVSVNYESIGEDKHKTNVIKYFNRKGLTDKVYTKVILDNEVILNTVMTNNYSTNGEIVSYTINNKLTNETNKANVEKIIYDDYHNIVFSSIIQNSNITFNFSNTYEYF